MTCEICTYYAEHKHLPPDHRGAHCRYCHRSWKGHTQAHCRHVYPDGHHCCAHFSSNGVANFHWGSGKSKNAPAYDAKHLDPATVALLKLGEDNVWREAHHLPLRPTWVPADHPRTRPGGSETSKPSPSTTPPRIEAQ